MNKILTIGACMIFSILNVNAQRGSKPAKWVGTYQNGNEKISMFSDNSYLISQNSFSQSGIIKWEPGMVASFPEMGKKFKVLDDKLVDNSTKSEYNKSDLVIIDSDGGVVMIGGDNANNEHSIDDNLTGGKWVLTELMGKKIEWPQDKKAAYIEFGTDGKYGGYTGCNTFGGDIKVANNMKLQLGQAMQTMKACLGSMEVEQGLNQVLQKVDNYSVNNGVLSLNKARMATLAKFKFVKN